MSESDLEYLKALGSTGKLNTPPLGLARTSSVGTSTNDKLDSLVKQNNTLIELVIQLSKRVSVLEEKLFPIDTLTQQLEGLQLGTPRPRKKRTPFYAVKDPKEIFEQEVAKLKK